jgi:4-amino-4-deoxy-L-arabinose transferase-like glycosyltransferase
LISIDADEPIRKTLHWTGALTFLSVAAAVALLHLLTNWGYGFHRDELQFLSDARHLDFGFVPYPPFTCAVERLGLELFGLSPVGLRLFSVLAQTAVVILTGLMARELGGGRLAQFIAMLAVAFSPVPLFQGTEFQYSSFDLLWWVLTAFLALRLLRTQNPRLWLAIGGAIGIGLETKYTICFLAAGLLLGFLVSPSRNLLRNRWFVCGIMLAFLIFLPNLIWQARHEFITLHFLQYIHARDVRWGRGGSFWFKQFFLCSNIWAAPLWLAGIWFCLRHERFRPLAVMYLFPALFFTATRAVFYYLAPAYPMMTAMGAVGFCRRLASLRPLWRNMLAVLELAGLLLGSIASIAMVIPFPAGWWFHDFGLKHNDALREEIGWDELIRTVAQIRNSLPPEQQAHLGITTANYGEYGAIEILGRAYGLPEPIGTTNSEWLRGYPTPAPTTLIVLGLGADEANAIFTGCRLADHDGNLEGLRNEESQYHPDIFVCGPPRIPWEELWKEHRDFG